MLLNTFQICILLKTISNNFFIHKVKSDVGNYEFCKILCRNGHWRGPVCRVEIDDIKGKERISNSLGVVEANIISC